MQKLVTGQAPNLQRNPVSKKKREREKRIKATQAMLTMIFMYICLYVPMHIYVCMYVNMCMHECVYTRGDVCMYMVVYVWVCFCVLMCGR